MHRDLKLENLLLASPDEITKVCLLDSGRLRPPGCRQKTHVTRILCVGQFLVARHVHSAGKDQSKCH